jgi:hypothetical protein
MVRLPTPGGDDDIWGDLLNDFLEVSLDNTNVDEGERGKLKPTAVDEAGAVMNTDTSTADMDFVVDEDAMTSDSATKIPTQQSVKAYVDSLGAGYAVLAGKSGGQTINGGTGSGENLLLRSTSHATKGVISIGSSPSEKVVIGGTSMPETAAASFGINSNGTFAAAGSQMGIDARAKPTFSTTTGGEWTGADFTSLPTATTNMTKITGILMQAGPGGASSGTITDSIGVSAFGTNAAGSATVTTGTAIIANTGSVVGALTNSYGIRVENGTFAGTTTNTTGIYVNALPGSTSKIGLDIAGQSSATTNIGVRIAKSDTYSLQLSSTAGDAASGITFGTDTNLYRSAADTLKTDDKLLVTGEFELDGALNHDGSTVGFFGATPVSQSTGWSVSNEATIKNYDANATTINEMADVLGTLIEYLKTIGILGA